MPKQRHTGKEGRQGSDEGYVICMVIRTKVDWEITQAVQLGGWCLWRANVVEGPGGHLHV